MATGHGAARAEPVVEGRAIHAGPNVRPRPDGSLHPVPATDWLVTSLDDAMTPVIAGLDPGVAFALATLHAADGGPRPVGAQMVITADRWWGFMSGGCVEADIAGHARAALNDGQPRRLTYGRGSPAFDIRLPCGGRIDLLIESVTTGDPAIAGLLDRARRRRPARYLSDGCRRLCLEPDARSAGGAWTVDRVDVPLQRLIVVGHDPFAVAIALEGHHQGWDVNVVAPSPKGDPPSGQPSLGPRVIVAPPVKAIEEMVPDVWTAVAVATHDAEDGDEALLAALRSGAGYVGALGSRRRLGERRARLAAAGLPDMDLDRLRAPIGLPIAARSPREIAVAVIAEIIGRRASSVA